MPFGYNVSPILLPSAQPLSGGQTLSGNSVYVDANGDGFYDRDVVRYGGAGDQRLQLDGGVENSGKLYIGATAFVSGWGITSPKGGASPVLKAAELKVKQSASPAIDKHFCMN